MNKHTAMETPPPTQKVRVIVSSIPPQLEAMSVQYHGVKIWNKTEPRMTKKNTIPACIEVI